MKYHVLVEVLKPAFAWVEVEAEEHPQEAISAALDATRNMSPQEFVDRNTIDPCMGPIGCDDVIAPFALVVIDENGVQQYTRIEQEEALREMARIEAEYNPAH